MVIAHNYFTMHFAYGITTIVGLYLFVGGCYAKHIQCLTQSQSQEMRIWRALRACASCKLAPRDTNDLPADRQLALVWSSAPLTVAPGGTPSSPLCNKT